MSIFSNVMYTTKTVRNTMNDRPFNATDAEHFLCKGWVDAKLTLGHLTERKREWKRDWNRLGI